MAGQRAAVGDAGAVKGCEVVTPSSRTKPGLSSERMASSMGFHSGGRAGRGAGGGGYLILVADGFVPDAIQIRIRRQYAVF